MPSVNYLQPNFSHIYIEDYARSYPLTNTVLGHFPNVIPVDIHNYKDFFNRPRQDFQLQKQSLKLILAVKQPPFLYPLTDIHQTGSNNHRYYATPLLNCLYHCEYCFLQGLYLSANMVLFVNQDAFFQATNKALDNHAQSTNPLWLSIAYQTDLLAFERVVPFCREWIEFAMTRPELILEIRTKSAFFAPLKTLSPPENVVLAWSLSPETVVTQLEHRTPPLKKRLKAIQEALRYGWKVRICIDPVMAISNWRSVYGSFITSLFQQVSGEDIYDVVLGVFRMNREFFHRIRKQNPNSSLYYQSYPENRVVSIPEPLRQEVLRYIKECLVVYLPDEKIIS